MPIRISSRSPGRLRLRGEDLRHAARNSALCQDLQAWDGIVAAEGNPRTGGILLRYDPDRLDAAIIEARLAIAALEEPPETKAESNDVLWRLNRYAKWGMLGALGGTVAALAIGKTMHAALGAAHLAFLAVHLSNHRKKILK